MALIQAVADNPTDETYTGTLVAALYQGEKLVETQQILLTVEGGSTERSTVSFDAAGGGLPGEALLSGNRYAGAPGSLCHLPHILKNGAAA